MKTTRSRELIWPFGILRENWLVCLCISYLAAGCARECLSTATRMEGIWRSCAKILRGTGNWVSRISAASAGDTEENVTV